MKKTIGIIFGMLFLGTAINSVSAQDKPKAGDLIYGTVTDSEGSVAGVVIINLLPVLLQPYPTRHYD